MQKIFAPLFIKRALLGVCILTLGLGIFYFFQKNYFFEKRLPQESIGKKESGLLFQKQQKDYQEFLNKHKAKDIFVAGFKEEAKTSDADRNKILKAIEGLRLVGVIAGEPTRVMIEDTKLQRTFYLKQGESFLENITVEKIGKSSVILNSYGEKFELYL